MNQNQGPATDLKLKGHKRAQWLKTLLQWHWISSALCLAGMLLFSITGFTLNHAGDIEARPQIHLQQAELPTGLLQLLETVEVPSSGQAPIPTPVANWLHDTRGVRAAERTAEWSEDEVYLSLPRPGGDAWLRIDRVNAEIEYEQTDRGWVAYFNDLHKGRHTGTAWSWFIDLFAFASLVFCITGLLILKVHAANRASVWPITGLGLVVPVVLALLFIH